MTFLGHLIKKGEICPDPEKIKAITQLNPPKDVKELRHFMGMVNYIMKFVPRLAELTAPLRTLLQKGVAWTWGPTQYQGWGNIKKAISSVPVLAGYETGLPIRVAADASTKGLGAVLEQQHIEGWKPVMFASRTLSETEGRYAQIEKEALAITWACEKFQDYLLGTVFELLTDHKPLVELMARKPIAELSARLQRFRMRLLCFDFKVTYIPGKHFYTPDILSRDPMEQVGLYEDVLEEKSFVLSIIQALPCSDMKLQQIKEAQEKDMECKEIANCLKKQQWQPNSCFWKYRDEFNVQNGLLLKGSRMFIPQEMRKEMLMKLHQGHLGIVKCRSRAKESVWWPGISEQIKSVVANCPTCREHRNNRSEPLMLSKLPDAPWEALSADLLKFQGKWYLVIQDYYSRFLELVHVNKLTSEAIINRLKNIFARHGIPVSLRTDGGTQFTADMFKRFQEEYGFRHVISSPHFAQSNGSAEKAVDIAKRILKKNKDPNLALLEYRTTPLEQGLSPAELLYGRKLRSTLPSIKNFARVSRNQMIKFKEKDAQLKERNKQNFDRRNGVKVLPQLQNNSSVWIPDMKKYGQVARPSAEPRSYIVKTPSGELRRNRKHIIVVAEDEPDENAEAKEKQAKGERVEEEETKQTQEEGKRERSGRTIKPPKRYSDSDF